ncbi:dihydrodipicolinate synthase family protein [Candidatus Riflebacteria bacterium]
MAIDFKGLIVPILTPFQLSGEIDFETLESHLNFLEKQGVQGILLMTITGEFSSLFFKEKKELIDFAVEHSGRMQVLACTGSCSLMETIEITRYSEKKGVDAVVISPPFFYTHIHMDGILNYFAMIMENISAIPIILYNIPRYTGIEIDARLLKKLTDYPHMYGILDESGNFFNVLGFMKNYQQLKIFSGFDPNIHLAASANLKTFVSPMANIFPEFLLKVIQKIGQKKGIIEEQQVIVNFYKYTRSINNCGALKYLLTLRGLRESLVRPPLLPLETERKDELDSFCRTSGLLMVD